MRISDSRLRRIIREVILETMTPEMERSGMDSEDAWANMYQKKKGLNLRGEFPELRGFFNLSKNIEEPSDQKKKNIFKFLGLEKGVFDDLHNAGKSDLQKARRLYDERKYKKPENLKQVIRNYNMLIALFRKCDLKSFMMYDQYQASSFGTKNYISDSKSLKIVTKPVSFSKSKKSNDYIDAFMQRKNHYFYDEIAPNKKLTIINRISANTTYTKFNIIEIKFDQLESTNSFIKFLKQNGYARIYTDNIAALKKEAIKTTDAG